MWDTITVIQNNCFQLFILWSNFLGWECFALRLIRSHCYRRDGMWVLVKVTSEVNKQAEARSESLF